MARIEKKAWPELFEKVMNGQKNFDLRLADFDIAEGDTLVLREWDPEKKDYTGREVEKEAKIILKTKDQKFWPDQEVEKYGFQVIGF